MDQNQSKSKNIRLGILGGGQLALMLGDAAKTIGLNTHIFATSKSDPAINHCDQVSYGSFDSTEDLRTFFDSCSHVIFENEFIPQPILESASSDLQVQLIPSAKTMGFCADKLEQKLMLNELDIPTAPFITLNKGDNIADFLASCQERFETGFVLKWAKGGYDGGGVLAVTNNESLAKASYFLSAALEAGSRAYAEGFVGFETEVALVSALASDRNLLAYPLVETVQRNHICNEVIGPSHPSFQSKAEEYAKKIASKIDLYGVFAIEFFVCGDTLMVNELAPRVHNSGHCTMEGCNVSQFELHLTATLGLSTPKISSKPIYGMLNILGPLGYTGPLDPPKIDIPHTKVHWYEKTESRPGRKIGHLNVWLDDGDQALFDKRLAGAQKQLDLWAEQVSRS